MLAHSDVIAGRPVEAQPNKLCSITAHYGKEQESSSLCVRVCVCACVCLCVLNTKCNF